MKSDNNVIVILSLILTVLLGVSGFLIEKQFSRVTQKNATIFAFSKSAPSVTPSVLGASESIFSSDQLGIKFSYVQNGTSPSISVDQTIHSVSLVVDSKIIDSSSATIIAKPPQTSFYEAIKSYMLLNGGSLARCTITVEDPRTFSEYSNQNFVTATILGKGSAAVSLCPFDTQADFFVMNLQYPNKFIAIHKGAAAIYADITKNKSWEQSLTFLQ